MATKFYLINQTPLFVPTTVRGAWNAIPSSRAFMLGTNKFGGVIDKVTEAEIIVTAPHSVLILRGVSSKLQTQTIDGYLDVVLGIRENSVDANFYWHVHAFVTQGDTDTVRGTLLSNYVEDVTNEWPQFTFDTQGQAKALQFAAPLTPVNALSGDRIVIEFGYVARNVATTSYNGTIFYGTQVGILLTDAPDIVIDETVVLDKAGSIDFTKDLLFESVAESIGHIIIQTVEDVPPARAEIAHQIVQVAEITHPATRIAHIVVQVVEGTAPTPVDISGIYFIDPNKAGWHDSYYGAVERKIPDPIIRSAYLGE